MFQDYFKVSNSNLVSALKLGVDNNQTLNQLTELYFQLLNCIQNNAIVYFFGNGGSAAQATHIAGEFTSFCIKKHNPWGAISLNDSISNLTAISNDYGFESVFERQILGLATEKDLIIALSTSGSSLNITTGLKTAKKIGCTTVLLTSERFSQPANLEIDIVIKANTTETTRIQEIHLFWLHTIIEYLEVTL